MTLAAQKYSQFLDDLHKRVSPTDHSRKQCSNTGRMLAKCHWDKKKKVSKKKKGSSSGTPSGSKPKASSSTPKASSGKVNDITHLIKRKKK